MKLPQKVNYQTKSTFKNNTNKTKISYPNKMELCVLEKIKFWILHIKMWKHWFIFKSCLNKRYFTSPSKLVWWTCCPLLQSSFSLALDQHKAIHKNLIASTNSIIVQNTIVLVPVMCIQNILFFHRESSWHTNKYFSGSSHWVLRKYKSILRDLAKRLNYVTSN